VRIKAARQNTLHVAWLFLCVNCSPLPAFALERDDEDKRRSVFAKNRRVPASTRPSFGHENHEHGWHRSRPDRSTSRSASVCSRHERAAHPTAGGLRAFDTIRTRTADFHAGERANQFYLIESGKVAIEASIGDRPAVTIDFVEAEDLLGWSWMFPPFIWHFNARALLPTSAIFFYGTILSEYCEKNPALGFELFKRMSAVMLRRLQAAREKMLAALEH
jgi:CRP-like cAMP-binding protein